MSLLKRFENFLATQPGAESIDALAAGINAGAVKRADYFLRDRSVILEIKTLSSDPDSKPQAFVEKLCSERDIWVFGKVSTTQIFEKQKDRESLEFELYSRVTRACQDAVADSQHQIVGTRKLFDAPDALGVLVLINEAAPTLDIELMANRVARTLRRREGNAPKYPAVDGALLLSEQHSLVHEQIRTLFPIISMLGSGADERRARMRAVGAELLQAWAAHNGHMLLDESLPSMNWPLRRT